MSKGQTGSDIIRWTSQVMIVSDTLGARLRTWWDLWCPFGATYLRHHTSQALVFATHSDPVVLWVKRGLISAASRERWQRDLRKANRAHKQSVFVSAQTPHFHSTKGNADFSKSRSSRALFPPVSRWENTSLLLVQKLVVTQKMPRECLSL